MLKSHKKNDLMAYFKKVNEYRGNIYHLQNTWDNLALLAQLSATGSEMEHTRSAFSQISTDVLENLSSEILSKTISHLSSKAFVIINLLVRNLYERTADIGFFATDDDIRYFLHKYDHDEIDNDDLEKITFRFQEYQKKYTVYENIVLYDKEGRIVHQLDETNHTLTDYHDIFQLASVSDAPYVERFYETEIHGRKYKSLVYAHVVKSSDETKTVGVLCLCFKFENELQTIFSNLISEDDWTVGLLLNEHQQVIASSDSYQIPMGAVLHTCAQQEWTITRFAGREYLAVTRKSIGYQGYHGPGWFGLAMIPIEYAFEQNTAEMVKHIDESMLSKVMRSPLIFSATLLDIPKKAAIIQSKLNQSVWNGNIWQSNYVDNQQKNFSKTLLWEISNTGLKTQTIIEKIVSELYQTVVSVMLENSRFYAYLAVDIMDRNLYERANDVRWWALTYSFRKILSQPKLEATDKDKVERILLYVNSLYTVYDNLLVFDKRGEIIAVSNFKYKHLLGTTLQEEWLTRVKGCQSYQDYVVSKFESTYLYNGDHTYVYAAPIRHVDESSMVGGIAIVFDSTPQFNAMLQDVLPRDVNGKALLGSFTLFVDETMKILASTHKEFVIGDTFQLLPQINKLEQGHSLFDIAVFNESYYAVGAHASGGYREYKGPEDSYRNKVIALIFTPLGNALEINQLIAAEELIIHNKFNPNLSLDSMKDAVEYATFFVKNTWFGINASHVLEAIDEDNIRTFPDGSIYFAGVHQYRDEVIPIIDMAKLLGYDAYDTNNRQIIVIEDKALGQKYGVLISALGEIPYINELQIQPMFNLFNAQSRNPAVGVVQIGDPVKKQNMLTVVTARSIWEKAMRILVEPEANESANKKLTTM